MLKDVLVGVAISWLTLTSDGKRFQEKAKKFIVERYILSKSAEKTDNLKEEGGDDDDA